MLVKCCDYLWWLHYITSIFIFLTASFFIWWVEKYEKKSYPNTAYPSLGLMSIAVLYLYFQISGILLWIFPVLGEAFRSRFGYQYSFYSFSMALGLMAMIFTYWGYRIVINWGSTKLSLYPIELERIILAHKKTVLLICFLMILIVIILTYVIQDLGFAGYGGGNYRERMQNNTNKILSLIKDFFICGFHVVVYLAYLTKEKLPRVVLILSAGMLMALGISEGSLLGVMGYVFPFVIVYLYSDFFPQANTKQPNKRLWLFIITMSVLLVIFIFFKGVSRSLINLGVGTGFVKLFLSADTTHYLAVLSSFVEVQDYFVGFIQEISGVDIFSLIMQKIYNMHQDFLYGYSYLLIPGSFIPSLLWAGKPETTLATWFADTYWYTADELADIGEGNQANVFLLSGEAFLNFGPFGIAPIMFLYGMLIGLISRIILQRGLFGLFFFILLCRIFFDVLLPAFTFAALISNLVKQTIIVTVFFIMLCGMVKLIDYAMNFLKTASLVERKI